MNRHKQPRASKTTDAATRPKARTKAMATGLPHAQTETQELRDYTGLQDKIIRGLRSFISEMTVVFRFIETVSAFHSQERIVQFLMDVIKELCAYDAGALYLNEQVVVAYELQELEAHQQKLELDERIYNWVFRQGHAVIVPESFMRQKPETSEPWSFMIAPLATSNERLGRIELLFKRQQGTFTQQTFSILNVLLQHAAVILMNERVYAKERETAKKYVELDLLKQDVVNTTTHEIKTPLTIIQAAGILLERNRKLKKAERTQLLNKIIQQCGRIDQIVTELFETSQAEESQPRMQWEMVALEALTQEALADVYYDANRIHFELRFPAELLPVRLDRPRMFKTLRNLIENAVKYSPQGGTISIMAENAPGQVVWKIKDQGVGISEEDQHKVFNKFFRAGNSTTRSVRGMGFGLYLAKKNAELNQGKISVISQPDHGSTFILEFPAEK